MPKDLTIPARKNRIIVLEEMNFVWDKHQLNELSEMWADGESIEGIAEHFDRDPDEILLALIHIAREDKITARRTGLKGDR
jgi:hypothetical protein